MADDLTVLDTALLVGIPSLFRCPVDPIPRTPSRARRRPPLLGNGSTERDQHLGPRAVRNVSGTIAASTRRSSSSPWERVPDPRLRRRAAARGAWTTSSASSASRPSSSASPTPARGPSRSAATTALRARSSRASRAPARGSPTAARSRCSTSTRTPTLTSLPHWNGAINSAANWADYLVQQGNVDPLRSRCRSACAATRAR